MIEPPVAIRLVKGKTRCHPYLGEVQVFYAVTTAAIGAEFGIKSPAGHQSHMVLACRAGKADVALPLNGYVKAALDGKEPDEVIVRIEPKAPAPKGFSAPGMEGVSGRIVAAVFALFVETCNDWVKRNHSTGYSKWPPVSNFCRVVRNAIVHGGKISINSETAVGGSWRHLSYNYRHHGKPILNDGDLSIGDLVLLMLELEVELNELGAPFDLG